MQNKNVFKEYLKTTFLLTWVNYYRHRREIKRLQKELKLLHEQKQNELTAWEQRGRPVPPPQAYKIATIKEYAKKYKTEILIETGTYLGETTQSCVNDFKQLISIELDQQLFENATAKFAGNNKVTILQGDSGTLLKEVISTISKPCLFWLDGHYSEGVTAKGTLNTPIIDELNAIFNHAVKNHVIIIDDARCFIGQDDYPSIDELKNMVYKANPAYQFIVENDSIRINA